MRFSEILREETTTLDQLYQGDFPDRNETYWDYVRPGDNDLPLEVRTMQKHMVQIMLLSQYRAEHVDEIVDMLDEEQHGIVESYVNDPTLSSKVIVIAGDKIVDGNHRALAAAIKGTTIRYVDLVDLGD